MFFIINNDQRFIKEDLFGFEVGHTVLLPILKEVAIIPIEACCV